MSYSALDLYRDGLDFFGEQVQATPDDGWSRPTVCAAWSALDVLGHVGATTDFGAKILAGPVDGFAPPDPPSEAVTGDPNQWWFGLARQTREALDQVDDLDRVIDSPAGPRTIRDGLSFPAADLFLHGWDLAASDGRLVAIPDAAIAFIRGMFAHLPDDVIRHPGAFGPAVEAPQGASATEELMAFCGRNLTRT